MGEMIEALSPVAEDPPSQTEMIGHSPPFLHCVEELRAAAVSGAAVLLQGETGTGKELAASFIHRQSARSDAAFLTVDCTVLPESLFEAEVFGHARGAFTGSVGEKRGIVDQANGGTLFLDEIGELPLSQQSKLLRFLETGDFRQVGGRKILHVDTRIICATNCDLTMAVRQGSFREDLYYRIACLTVEMPALRERREDIPQLAETLLLRIGKLSDREYTLTDDAIKTLVLYDYPGNIRELRNVLIAAASRSRSGKIDHSLIEAALARARECNRAHRPRPSPPVAEAAYTAAVPPVSTLAAVEAHHIAGLLHQHGGSRRAVARALGITERTLYRKLKRYRIT